MDNNYTLHVKLFNDKVRAMNQSNAKLLTLNPQEARSLHAEIYDLMSRITELTKEGGSSGSVTSVSMDGGSFK
jgi:hypothetical protein